MLPEKFRNTIFDKLSSLTMKKFFNPVSLDNAEGLLEKVLIQSERDFFVNGTITSHAASPELMAGMWVAGREIALVNGYLTAWLKKAMGAALSEVNRCPYCEDMLLGLTLGAQKANLANALILNDVGQIEDELTQQRMAWVKASSNRHSELLKRPPFTHEQMPEALGNLIVFGYTNRISDFTLDGSPVPRFGKGVMLKFLGLELQESAALDLKPGISLELLPEGKITKDLEWSLPNILVARSLAAWSRVLENNIVEVMSQETRDFICHNLTLWEGGATPIPRAWVDDEIKSVPLAERNKAKLALLVAKASYQIDDTLIQQLVDEGNTESDLIKLGAWSAFWGAKTVANWCWQAYKEQSSDTIVRSGQNCQN